MRNLKKVIALVAVFAMLVSTVAFAQTYSDVAANDTYAEAIETLSMLGILTGDDADGNGVMEFRPNDTITRAEVAAIVCRIQGLTAINQTATDFVDVPSSHWASGYVAQAAGQGIVNGYGDGNFGPDDNVLYEQAVKMLMETLGYNPFAVDNGGYPSGYLTAAQRYGVLEGVVGGANGVEANRGMVAQMVFNAIDTCLMEKSSYGSDAEYAISDGKGGRTFATLLTRDLKVVKASGIVTQNSYTDLAGIGASVDLEADKTVTLTLDDSEVNDNYLGTAAVTFTADQGDVDADAFLGYVASVYAKKVGSEYELLAIAKDSSMNKEESFTLDQFDSITGNKITYTNDSDVEKTVTIAGTYDVVLNGVAVEDDLSVYFGAGSNFIKKDNTLNGTVTFVNTKNTTGYELINIEVATIAVVKRVASNGQIFFDGGAKLPYLTKINDAYAMDFSNETSVTIDEEDTTSIFNLTKEGKAIDYTELQEWDVLNIVNGDLMDVCNVEVLAGDSFVDGQVSATRNNQTEAKLTDGKWYDTTIKFDAGDAGRFYVVNGKIVAWNDEIVVPGVETSVADNYAIVLNAAPETDSWGNSTIKLQILDKTGAIREVDLVSTDLTIKNSDAIAAIVSATPDKGEFKFDVEDLAKEDATKVSDLIKNVMISYTENTSGKIKALTFAQTGDEDADLHQVAASLTDKATYKEDDMKIGSVEIDENTLVFYMTNKLSGGTVTYGEKTVLASADYSKVGVGADLVGGDYNYVAFDAADGAAKAIIIMNTAGAIAESANVAVIEGTAKTTVSGETVTLVEFWMNGELKEATTAVGLEEDMTTAVRGDVYQMKVTNGIITAANKLFTYGRTAGTNAFTGSLDVAQNTNTGAAFGAIYSINKRGSVALKLNGTDVMTISAADADAANVYVMDPNKKNEKQLFVGTIDNALVNEDFVEAGNKIDIDRDGDVDVTVGNNNEEYSLLDYAFAYNYDGDTIDIVIYKPYEFTYKLAE